MTYPTYPIYRPGYTAYEHARIGSCRTAEIRQDVHTFCFHAHRVFIPRITTSGEQIAAWFHRSEDLLQPEDLSRFAGCPYVYYEVGDTRCLTRTVYLGHRGIPSQFMRRILNQQIGLGRPWDWRANLNTPEMADTVSILRSHLFSVHSALGQHQPLGDRP